MVSFDTDSMVLSGVIRLEASASEGFVLFHCCFDTWPAFGSNDGAFLSLLDVVLHYCPRMVFADLWIRNRPQNGVEGP